MNTELLRRVLAGALGVAAVIGLAGGLFAIVGGYRSPTGNHGDGGALLVVSGVAIAVTACVLFVLAYIAWPRAQHRRAG